MKPLAILLLLSIILITHCDNQLPIIGKKKKADKGNQIQIIFDAVCYFGSLITGKTTGKKLIDRGDGTLSINLMSQTGCPGIIIKEYVKSTIFILKKCLQGQIYRKEANDCKGTGTEADYYGAQKLQWCNLFGCSDSIRPALSNCTSEKFNNLSWSLNFSNINREVDKDLILNLLSSFSINQQGEIPQQSNDYYWLDGFAYNLKGDNENITLDSTQQLYVRCIEVSKQ